MGISVCSLLHKAIPEQLANCIDFTTQGFSPYCTHPLLCLNPQLTLFAAQLALNKSRKINGLADQSSSKNKKEKKINAPLTFNHFSPA